MAARLENIIYPVKDIDQAKALFTALLGTAPTQDAPYYVGFEVEGQPTVGLDPNGHRKGLTAPVPYWKVEDIEASIAELTGAGATLGEKPQDVGGGRQIATVTDSAGNVIGLVQDA
ncbi:VOC family protein [Streptomyces monticola]|uniref:VOC family protein n=1 Tax=Streptomyces monticola TaxID=2666263 RepID=A0ABW2JFR1_9ACTN